MNETTTDGTASPAVHGDATPTSDTGVPVLPCPTEARGLASRAPERDEAGPPDVLPARPGDQAEPPRGYRGQAFLDEVERVQAEQGRRQRGDQGRRARYAQRAAPAYRAGGNRRGVRT